MTNNGESHLFLESGGSNLITKASNLIQTKCSTNTQTQIIRKVLTRNSKVKSLPF